MNYDRQAQKMRVLAWLLGWVMAFNAATAPEQAANPHAEQQQTEAR